MSLPTAPFNIAKSIFAGKSVIQITPTGGSAIAFESRKLDSKVEQEFKDIQRPDAFGVMRVVRRVMVKCVESFEYEVDEAKRIVTDLFPGTGGAGALAGNLVGTVQIWEPDPQDATGIVTLKSESFACQINREGDIKFGDSDFTKATIKINSLKAGAVQWTPDVAP